MINFQTAQLLDCYFQSITHNNYIDNILSGSKYISLQVSSQRMPDLLNRKMHAYAHITVVESLNNREESFIPDRHYFYVTRTDDTSYCYIRRELVTLWADDKYNELLVYHPEGYIWCVPMRYAFSHNKGYIWADNGDILERIELPENVTFSITESNIKPNNKKAYLIMSAWKHIQKVSYSQYRNESGKTYTLATYKTGAQKSYHRIKSLRQFYNVFFNEDKPAGVSLRTIQRRFSGDKPVAIFMKDIYGRRFWVSNDDSISAPLIFDEDNYINI